MKKLENVAQSVVGGLALGVMAIGVCQIPGYIIHSVKVRATPVVSVVRVAPVPRAVPAYILQAALAGSAGVQHTYARVNPEDERNARRARASEQAEVDALKGGASEEEAADAAADAAE